MSPKSIFPIVAAVSMGLALIAGSALAQDRPVRNPDTSVNPTASAVYMTLKPTKSLSQIKLFPIKDPPSSMLPDIVIAAMSAGIRIG